MAKLSQWSSSVGSDAIMAQSSMSVSAVDHFSGVLISRTN